MEKPGRLVLVSSLLAAALVWAASPAQATLVIDMQFLNNDQTIGPTDSITAQVRLTNNSTAGETFGEYAAINTYGVNGLGSQGGFSQGYGQTGGFDFNFFDGVVIGPGESIDVEHFTFLPFPGPSVPEQDANSFLSIHLQRFQSTEFVQIEEEFRWQVRADAAIPAPATVSLLAAALLLIGLGGRRPRR